MGLHPDQRRMIQYPNRHPTRPEENELVEVEIQRDGDFAVRSFETVDQKFRLEIEQLRIARNFAGRHVLRLQIGQIALGVEITALPQTAAVRSDQDRIQPDLRLRTERSGGEIIPLAEIPHAVMKP